MHKIDTVNFHFMQTFILKNCSHHLNFQKLFDRIILMSLINKLCVYRT